jgi:hypothetical protein
MKKSLSVLWLGAALSLGCAVFAGSAFAEEIIVKTAPPHAIVEKRPVAPSHDHIWIAGYHRWDGHAYVWVPGRWELPPRAHAVWIAPRWDHRNGGYVFVDGYWK